MQHWVLAVDLVEILEAGFLLCFWLLGFQLSQKPRITESLLLEFQFGLQKAEAIKTHHVGLHRM